MVRTCAGRSNLYCILDTAPVWIRRAATYPASGVGRAEIYLRQDQEETYAHKTTVILYLTQANFWERRLINRKEGLKYGREHGRLNSDEV
jgi:hypothetical protein